MKKKPIVLIYSDCYLYGGSEKVIQNLLRNPILSGQYQFRIAYRKHRLYQQEVDRDYNQEERAKILIPLPIIANDTIFYHLGRKKIPRVLKKMIILSLLLISYLGLYFIYNITVQILVLLKVRPDIVHVNNGGYPAAKSCNSMVLAARLCGVKNVIYQVNNWAEKRTTFWKKFYDKLIGSKVTWFITASQYAKEQLVSNIGFNRDKIKAIPNTIAEEPVIIDKKKIFSELKIDENTFVLCNVALLSERKGQIYLLQALDLIKTIKSQLFDNIQLLLVGNGEEELKLKEYVKMKGLTNHVHFLGYSKNASDYINACDLFVFPSVASEDMPLAILSSMYLGKAVLATDLDGIKEEIENGTSGVLVSRSKETLSSDLAREICTLYEFNDRLKEYGINARIRYEQLFSSEAYGEKILGVYHSCFL